MANKLLLLPSNRLFNNSNIASPGGTAELYLSGGNTPANFLDADGVSLGSTLTANGLGQLPNAYQDETVAYRLILKDKDGVELDGGDIDPFFFGSDNTLITLAPGASVSTRSALAAVTNPAAKQSAVLTESGREGTFVFDSSDLSAKVAADTLQGIYVAPSTDTTGASGAWVRKFEGAPTARMFGAVGDGTTDDGTAMNTAITTVAALGINQLRFDTGHTFYTAGRVIFGSDDVVIVGHGATINSAANFAAGSAFLWSGARTQTYGLSLRQSGTTPYAEVTGADVIIEDCTFPRDATSSVPFYQRPTATGLRFRYNKCPWYGGPNIVDPVDAEYVGNSFINPVLTASDDGLAIKSTGTGAIGIRVKNNYFEGVADFVGIGSEIGVAGATDATYSHVASAIEITGNYGFKCARIVMIKPGGVDGIDYRDGTVRGVTISNNSLYDPDGTNLLNGILIQPGRGARVIDVTGKNNRVIGRCKTGGANLYGMYIFCRNDGTGTADCVVEKVDVGIEVIDPYNGAASGGSAPGSPFVSFFVAEKASATHGTVGNIVVDVIGNGCLNSGIAIQDGYDNAVHIRRAHLSNVVASNSSSEGCIKTRSAITIGSELAMTVAAGSSGVQYKINAGSITPALPKQLAANSIVGNSASSVADATAVPCTAAGFAILAGTTAVPTVLGQSSVAVSHTGDLVETTLATITVPAGAMGANGRIEVDAVFSFTGTAGTKTEKIKFGGTALFNNAPGATVTNYRTNLRIGNRSSASSQFIRSEAATSAAAFSVANSTAAVATGSSQDIVITGTLANAADTVTLESYQVVLYPKA